MSEHTASCRCGQLRATVTGEASAAAAAANEELGPDAGLDALVRMALRKAAK